MNSSYFGFRQYGNRPESVMNKILLDTNVIYANIFSRITK